MTDAVSDAAARAAFDRLARHGLQWVVVHDSARPHPLATMGKDAPSGGMHLRLASVSKLLVGRIALDLVAGGQLDPAALLTALLPGLPVGPLAGLRLADLLGHTSGLRDALEDAAFRATVNADVTAPQPMDRVLAASLALPRAQAGVRYANINALLVARACETVAGRPFPDLLAARVPAGCGLHLPPDGRLPAPHPAGWRHGRAPGRIEYGRMLFEAQGYNAAWSGAAGAMVLRVADLAALPVLLAPLAAETRLARQDGRLPDGGFHMLAQYRQGWMCHAGDLPGYSAWAGCHLESGRWLVVATGMCWIPDLGNAAHLVAQSLGAP